MSVYHEDLKKLSTGIKALGIEIPKTIMAMSTLIAENEKDSILSGKTKELISLGIAINERCDSCVLLHIANALKHGANKKEIFETIGVAIISGGGAAIVMGIKAIEMVNGLLTDVQETNKTAP